MSLREANKRDKVRRIREAALALWREKGFEATTTREVAERAGVAAGTLFLYVKTKEELVDLVFREEIAAVVEARFGSLPRRRALVGDLAHVFEGLLEFYARDRAIARLLLREALFAPPGSPGMALAMEFVGRAAELVKDARARGELAGDEPAPALAMQCFALYLGAVLGVVAGQPVAGALAGLRSALETHFLGLRTDPKPTKRTR